MPIPSLRTLQQIDSIREKNERDATAELVRLGWSRKRIKELRKQYSLETLLEKIIAGEISE